MISDDEDFDLQAGNPEFRRVRGPTIPEVVAERLRDAILTGRYKSGERLVEQRLAGLFGIGQPTVREALRELELQGFVRKRGNRGTYVTEFSAEDMRDHHEVRMALESVAVEKAAEHITPRDIAYLESLLEKMAGSAERFDLVTFHKADMSFHRRIWASAQNEYLAAMLERVVFSLFAFELIERRPGDAVIQHVAEQHRGILNAIQTHDAALARDEFARIMAEFWHRRQRAFGAS